MKHAFFLAWKYMVFNRARSLILIGGLSLVCYIPITLAGLVHLFQNEMKSRSVTTPLVLGNRGSRVDLILKSLYFQGSAPSPISMRDWDDINRLSLSMNLPLHLAHSAQGHPLVGTSHEYFSKRGLRLEHGNFPAVLGDCVVGSEAARALDLKADDRLMSDPEHLFDLAGAYPLNMRVTGVLQPSHSPDDRAVFTDLKTAWVIDGIGHGHQDLAQEKDESVILDKTDSAVVANSALRTYNEVTNKNLESFHFHAERDQLPLTSILVFPLDKKSGVLIQGKYLDESIPIQLVSSWEIVNEILLQVIEVKKFFDLGNGFVAFANLCFLALILMLSIRLRQQENQTLHHLGCSRGMMVRLIGAEWVLTLSAAFFLGVIGSYSTLRLAPHLVLRIAAGL